MFENMSTPFEPRIQNLYFGNYIFWNAGSFRDIFMKHSAVECNGMFVAEQLVAREVEQFQMIGYALLVPLHFLICFLVLFRHAPRYIRVCARYLVSISFGFSCSCCFYVCTLHHAWNYTSNLRLFLILAFHAPLKFDSYREIGKKGDLSTQFGKPSLFDLFFVTFISPRNKSLGSLLGIFTGN